LEEAEFCNNIILINAGKLIAEGSSTELKSRYLTNKIFEIECNHVVKAMEYLEDSEFIDDTSIFGNTIHVSVNSNFHNKNQIIDLLNSKEITKIDRVDVIVPTLEDVFIYLLEKQNDK